MNKPVVMTPQLYSRFGAQFKRLQGMKQGQFVQWACSFWQNAYNEGFSEAQQKYTQSGINISDDIDASVYDADTLYSDLLTIRASGRSWQEILSTRLQKVQLSDSERIFTAIPNCIP